MPTATMSALLDKHAIPGVDLLLLGFFKYSFFLAVAINRLLQALLDLPVPDWHHHALLVDEAGRRLAKRHDALAIRALRELTSR